MNCESQSGFCSLDILKQGRTWMSPHAELLRDLLWVMEMKGKWKKLSHPQSWSSIHYPCIEDVEELPDGQEISSEDRQHEFELFIQPTISKC